MLFKNVAIRKGEDIFLFADVEFYFYNKHHKDIITHPRNCESMQWYVNDFGGIDLSFKSETKVERIVNDKKKLSIKPVLSNDSYFGGILIRELHNGGSGSSRAREFHPHPLTEPCVKVSPHTALHTLALCT